MLFDLFLMALSLGLIVTGIILLGKLIGEKKMSLIEALIMGIIIGYLI